MNSIKANASFIIPRLGLMVVLLWVLWFFTNVIQTTWVVLCKQVSVCAAAAFCCQAQVSIPNRHPVVAPVQETLSPVMLSSLVCARPYTICAVGLCWPCVLPAGPDRPAHPCWCTDDH